MFTDYKQAIVCPYCFETFSHRDVHFRMESYFDENNLNDEGYQEEDFLVPGVVPDRDRDRLIEQTNERKPFLIQDDELYTNWWKKYGETTEQAYGTDAKLPCKVYQLPVLNPSDPDDQKSLKVVNPSAEGADRYYKLDGNGMVMAVVDRFGEETRRRVCPYCHNPLPINYGKNEVKFISIIGITGSGKTVYLSQLLSGIQKSVASLNMTASATMDIASFIMNNPVTPDKPLPAASVEGRFSQPMVYDLSRSVNGSVETDTVVFYDIAGEDCQTPTAMLKYGKFVQHSDAILMLIDPKQIGLNVNGVAVDGRMRMEPQIVIETIHNTFLNLPQAEKCAIPLAVCVSKSDTILNYIRDEEVRNIIDSDIAPLRDPDTYDNIPEFNSADYNKLNQVIRQLANDYGPLVAMLRVGFATYNFFTFTATGCATESRVDPATGETYQYLTGPATPKRIAEPLFWIFCKFGYIRPHAPILAPVPRDPEKVYEVKHKVGLFKYETVLRRKSKISSDDKIIREVDPPEEYKKELHYEE